MSLVIDASMALAWVFERELPADVLRAEQLLASCGDHPWWVPGLWHLETANALVVAERRGVISADHSDAFLDRLHSLPITTDAQPPAERQLRQLELARRHALSLYDASYLELALRLGAGLASFDRKLNEAASSLGVALVP